VVHRSDNTDSASAASVESVGSIGSAACKDTAPLAGTARQRRHGYSQSQARSLNNRCGGSKGGGGMPLRGLTGCVECRAVSVEPMSRYLTYNLVYLCGLGAKWLPNFDLFDSFSQLSKAKLKLVS
jgi:hypothetical protein